MKTVGAKGKALKVGAVRYRSLAEAAKKNGVKYHTLYARVNRYGWTAGLAANRTTRKYVKKSVTA